MLTPDQRALSFFVAGTDTEIGKTLITTALLHGLASKGVRCAGMKPIAAGALPGPEGLLNEDVESIKDASNVKLCTSLVAHYVFHEPIAPHIAAQREARQISMRHIAQCYGEVSINADSVIVEGVGGFCVPLSDSLSAADMAVRLRLPVILVVGMRLGCISHALLTAEAIASRGLMLAGWVANTVDSSMACFQENVDAIHNRLAAPLLGIVPRLDRPCGREAARHLDLRAIRL